MRVITFPSTPVLKGATGDGWAAAELREILQSLAPQLDRGEASGWDVGVTDRGDPQFYLLGPPPDGDCVLCISRLGRLYVLEDGAGHLVSEHNSLGVLAEQIRSMLGKRRGQIAARLAVIWFALREAVEERLEPVAVESEELIVHVMPQLLAIA
ncbi:MAG: hypothetical protein IT537_06510 [Hyphomicrobiales bacterium]|nr:hypothetical protein [Hyphomicrobiales bacterium]